MAKAEVTSIPTKPTGLAIMKNDKVHTRPK